ncbi:bifunctional Macro domain/Macro domain-like [Babesia duncani]|uniref:Bifunctional Macro domain/Macro domain-like n=1 Tax=Babesia duncani TaxID=323732 RepID=A0AAD9UNW1_9APIC|nr:bifunctional Macro domain/Macro domain-like [Babesia duncani]
MGVGSLVCRHFGSCSFLQRRLKTVLERATRQQLDWNRKIESHADPNVDASSLNSTSTLSFRDDCKMPFQRRFQDNAQTRPQKAIKELGTLEWVDIGPFGKISAVHGDPLQQATDALLVPVPPNLVPTMGLGLRVLELGGKSLTSALVKRAKTLVTKQLDALHATKDEYKDQADFKHAEYAASRLEMGSVILTPTFGVAKATLLAFVVTPFFWQTSPREASLKLRHTIKRALEFVNESEISTVACPQIANAIYGYEPQNGYKILIEEAHDAMLGLDSDEPKYNLNAVVFVDDDEQTARNFSRALVFVAHVKIPELQTLPAPVYHNRQSERLIEFDESVLGFCKRAFRITYKRYYPKGSKRKRWLRLLKPYVWRPFRALEPPPLLLYKATGQPALLQHGPRPFYKNGVSHVHFPLLRPRMQGLQVGANGQWKARIRPEPIFTSTRSYY